MANDKIKYGLSQVHYAVLNDESENTYDTPKPIKGAVNLALSAEGDTSTFYADNSAYFVTRLNNGFSGDLEVARIPEDFLTEVLGYEKDEATGMLLEVANAIPKTVALMFQFEQDINAKRVVLFKVAVGRPGVNHKTKNESLEPETDTIPITVTPLTINDKTFTKGVISATDKGYADFFTKVTLPSSSKEVKKKEKNFEM
ncbi:MULTISPECIES: major tail protein [Helcococcus]|uniref:Major tail protein n=1 Tax=Helcococcus bovis TaxID=3153252 RepID=A0ABW9F8D8_9FIRM